MKIKMEELKQKQQRTRRGPLKLSLSALLVFALIYFGLPVTNERPLLPCSHHGRVVVAAFSRRFIFLHCARPTCYSVCRQITPKVRDELQ